MARPRAQVFSLCICLMLFSSGPGYAREKITFTPKEGSGQYEAKPESCEIQVFKDSKPEQEYVDLGIINYHDERHRSNAGSLKLDVVMPKIKALACKVGGDALIDIRVTEVRRLEFAMFNVRATVVRFAPKVIAGIRVNPSNPRNPWSILRTISDSDAWTAGDADSTDFHRDYVTAGILTRRLAST